jgi:hypothetical protein
VSSVYLQKANREWFGEYRENKKEIIAIRNQILKGGENK